MPDKKTTAVVTVRSTGRNQWGNNAALASAFSNLADPLDIVPNTWLFAPEDYGLTTKQPNARDLLALSKARLWYRAPGEQPPLKNESGAWVAILDDAVGKEMQTVMNQLQKFVPETTFSLRVGLRSMTDDECDVRAPYQMQIVLGAVDGQLVKAREHLSAFYRQWWVNQPLELRNKVSIDLET